MKVKFLSSRDYIDPNGQHGDCILIDTGQELFIYDCGSDEHAERVMSYIEAAGYLEAKFILSHNDGDHFDGLPLLIDNGKVSTVYTLLLLKYKEELLEIINDGRVTDKSLTETIADKYSNIYSLSGKVDLVDALALPELTSDIEIIGPEQNYALNAVAKFLDGREGDTIDGETIHNAICFQLKLKLDDGKYLLLSGDSAFAPLEDNLKTVAHIQLPHHGNSDIAQKVYNLKDTQHEVGIT